MLCVIIKSKITQDKLVFLSENLWKYNKINATFIESFVNDSSDVEPLTRHTIFKLNRRFEETGSVSDLLRSGRERAAVMGEFFRPC
jgi:hypothetical protein